MSAQIPAANNRHRCAKHNFRCATKDEFKKHLAEFEHTIRGKAPCNLCGVSVNYNVITKLAVKGKAPALCDVCRENLYSTKTTAAAAGETE